MVKITIEDLETREVSEVTGKFVSAFIFSPESGVGSSERVPDVISVLRGAGSPADILRRIATCMGVILTKFYDAPEDQKTIASDVMSKFIDGVIGEDGEMEITKWDMKKADELEDDK